MDLDETPLDARLLRRFARVARKYCVWAERGSLSEGYIEFMRNGLSIAAEVYWQACQLSQVQNDWDNLDVTESVIVALEDLDPKLAAPIEARFTRIDQESNERFGYMGMALSNMSDGLVKAYIGLRLGLDYLKASETDNALLAWQYGFASGWGYPLAEALSGMHSILYIA